MVAWTHERTTNPLTSAFVISWIGWNYKFFLVLFSELLPNEKMEMIKDLYPVTGAWWERLYGGAFAYPLAIALLYVFIYPSVSEWVLPWYRGRQIKLANTLKEKEGKRLRDPEEVARMVRAHEQELKQATDGNAALEKRVEDLRAALDQAETEVAVHNEAAQHSIPTPVIIEPDTDSGDSNASNPVPTFTEDEAKLDTERNANSAMERNLAPTSGNPTLIEIPKSFAESLKKRTFSTRDLRVLSHLAEGYSASTRDLAVSLRLKNFTVQMIIEDLREQGMVKSEGASFAITSLGKDVLRTLIALKLWDIEK